MKLISYESKSGNFGDDLNKWMWPKIFGEDFFNKDEDTAFLGIGSILISESDYIEEAEKFKNKIIFGTGVRSITQSFKFDNSWDISFLRGPFSSLIACGSSDNYITDSAYYLALLTNYSKLINSKKKYTVSVIPYYQSVDLIDWETSCKKLGWNLIKPTGKNVEDFIKQISESEYVISEAMHGAIVADVLRVPWKRLKFNAHLFEGEIVSEFKWKDWLYSIGIKNNTPINYSTREKKFKHNFLTWEYRKKNIKDFIRVMDKSKKTDYYLSNENVLKSIIKKLTEKKDTLIQKYL